jgi:hypothetical protein
MSLPEERDPVDRILAKAAAEVAAGRAWRAREILRGGVLDHCLDARFLVGYGRGVAAVGHRLEAGKFLFLSGVRGPDVDPAIDLFITRYQGTELRSLVAQFPAKVRRVGLDALPEQVRLDLDRLGLPPARVARNSMHQRLERPKKLGHSLIPIGCLLMAVVLLIAALIGLREIWGWALGV